MSALTAYPSYDELVARYAHAPETRAIGRVLHAGHAYDETPDAFEWWMGDACLVAHVLDSLPADPLAALCGALDDVNYCPEIYDAPGRPCLRAHAVALLELAPQEAGR